MSDDNPDFALTFIDNALGGCKAVRPKAQAKSP